MCCFAAEVAAFPGMEGLLSAKSGCACSGETLLGTPLGKTHLTRALTAGLTWDLTEGTAEKEGQL